MAIGLQGLYTNTAGVSVEYWKVVGINLSTFHKYADIQVVGYFTAEARENNLEVVETKKFKCNLADFDVYFSNTLLSEVDTNPISQAYIFLKDKVEMFKEGTNE